MTDEPNSPFDAPASDDSPHHEEGRPSRFTVIAVLALLLGLLGIAGALTSCISSGVNLLSSDLMTTGMSPEQAAAQQALLSHARPFVGVGLGLTLAVLPLGVLLLGGGTMVLANRRRGAKWLGWAFPFGLALEPVRLLVQILYTALLWDETMAVANATAQSAAGPGMSGMEQAFGGMMAVTVVLGVLFALFWTAVKMGFYLWGRRVLDSEPTRDWLTSLT